MNESSSSLGMIILGLILIDLCLLLVVGLTQWFYYICKIKKSNKMVFYPSESGFDMLENKDSQPVLAENTFGKKYQKLDEESVNQVDSFSLDNKS